MLHLLITGIPQPAYSRKAVIMRKTAVLILLLLASGGCAALEQKARMEKFDSITESFVRALRTADYVTAAKFLDPTAGHAGPHLKHLRNYKIAEYKVTRVQVSEDRQKITQVAELQYFRLNGNILHTMRYPQTWRYLPEHEIWLLQTGLPDFDSHHPQPARR
jgi:hypothetical protein